MIVRTSVAGEAGFKLLKDRMAEQPNIEHRRWFLWRADLNAALKQKDIRVRVAVLEPTGELVPNSDNYFYIQQGETQRRKKFIEIGCKRFVGVNRAALIRWASKAS